MKLLLSCLLLISAEIFGIEVHIDYSFYVPAEFGSATVQSANCCPYGHLPDNNTHNMAVPTVFGIGVQKGGTTTLYDHFQVHHQMKGTEKKELHFLDNAEDKSYKEYLQNWKYNRKSWTRVNDTWMVPPPEIGALFEISPSYIFVPFSACKAKIISPNAKFIVFLRDPVDRAYSGLSYTSVQMSHYSKNRLDWAQDSFWNVMKKGLLLLEKEPMCNFQTGKGIHSFNDCAGCMLRWPKIQDRCDMRPFVTLKDHSGNYDCNHVGREHLLRGLYGAQLAWWFTLFDPSQFKIINSEKFFKFPMQTMKEIGKFLELNPYYAKWMMERSRSKSNAGHYRKQNPVMIALTKELLVEFYRRPNLELYRLLHETGHRNFAPFEKELRSLASLDCRDNDNIISGICGDPRFYRQTEGVEGATLPKKVEFIHGSLDIQKAIDKRERSNGIVRYRNNYPASKVPISLPYQSHTFNSTPTEITLPSSEESKETEPERNRQNDPNNGTLAGHFEGKGGRFSRKIDSFLHLLYSLVLFGFLFYGFIAFRKSRR